MTEVPTVTLNNGVVMPQLGLGVFRMPPELTAENVATAIADGYRLIDTAALYGNETEVGEGARRSGVPREELFITTKVWNSDQGYENTLRAFEASLNKLGLDYLDLYLVHWPRPLSEQMIETWKAMEEIYKSGRVKAIGVCNFKPRHLDRLLNEAEIVPAVLQIELHPAFTQEEVRQYAKERGIQVESWFPLGGQTNVKEMLSNRLLTRLAKKYGKTPAQVVLRWHTLLGLVVIPKSSHAERLRENINIFDFKLTPEEVAAISSLNTGIRLGTDPDMFN